MDPDGLEGYREIGKNAGMIAGGYVGGAAAVAAVAAATPGSGGAAALAAPAIVIGGIVEGAAIGGLAGEAIGATVDICLSASAKVYAECVSSCYAGPDVREAFCRTLRSPAKRHLCWEKSRTGLVGCVNSCWGIAY